MTKAELVAKIASRTSLSLAATERAVNAFIKSVMEATKKGNRVSLVGFGTFSLNRRAPRQGRNPQTGEAIKIKASRVPKFRPGKFFRDYVN